MHPGGPWRIAGYCFGTIVAFELANQLLAEGEEVELLVVFNGPSPSWIKQWRWYGNQPSWRARHPRPAPPTRSQRLRGSLARQVQRLRRAAHEPRRLLTGALWQARGPYTGSPSRSADRSPSASASTTSWSCMRTPSAPTSPPSTRARSSCSTARGSTRTRPSAGRGSRPRGSRSYAVPGEHDNNRQAMTEPTVGFVYERLREHL